MILKEIYLKEIYMSDNNVILDMILRPLDIR